MKTPSKRFTPSILVSMMEAPMLAATFESLESLKLPATFVTMGQVVAAGALSPRSPAL